MSNLSEAIAELRAVRARGFAQDALYPMEDAILLIAEAADKDIAALRDDAAVRQSAEVQDGEL